ncbi:redoxin domain-containing protein [candidate division WOR-3 bacterium]|nr:redoxin domain-containing protein [candidate division WOR-3 bacterium]
MKVRIGLAIPLALAVLLPGAALAVLNVGDQAPNFTLPDTAWVNRQLSEFAGRVILLNFWAST